MCFYRFAHITDDLQSVTSRILHSTADFRSILLQTIWFSAYYRQFSFSKKCKDFLKSDDSISMSNFKSQKWFISPHYSQEKVLKKVILDDVLQRKKTKGLPIHKRKMFTKNSDMIFEQDFAQPHSTNANQQFMEEHFPAHTPTLWRFEDTDPLFFGPKWDDFWSIDDSGPSFLSEFIGIPDRLISVGSCGVCGRKCETQTLRLWPDLCTSSRQRWTRSTVWRGRKFREISIIGRAHMLANAPCVNLESLSVV